VSDADPKTAASDTDALPLWQIQKTLAGKKLVDLTHAFAPGILRWPGGGSGFPARVFAILP